MVFTLLRKSGELKPSLYKWATLIIYSYITFSSYILVLPIHSLRFPGITSQIKCLYQHPCSRLCFRRKSKKDTPILPLTSQSHVSWLRFSLYWTIELNITNKFFTHINCLHILLMWLSGTLSWDLSFYAALLLFKWFFFFFFFLKKNTISHLK
jgi:hypothetical protein